MDMNDQRIQACQELIEQLLGCPPGQEVEILQTHEELVDTGLLALMERVAGQMEQQDPNTGRVRQIAAQLSKAMGVVEDSQREMTSRDVLGFVGKLMQCIAETQGNRAQVYEFLQANLVQMDEALLEALSVAFSRFAVSEQPGMRESVAAIFVKFGNLIQHFPKGNRMLNLELAIAAYDLALQVYTCEVFPEQWATTQNNLASAYLDRIKGDRAKNMEQAIAACELALQVYTREPFPEKWAMTQLNLANACRERIEGERAENLEVAISIYEQVLLVLTRETFLQQWAMAQSNLGTAYSERIRDDRADNLERAITAYRQALQVRTREIFPREWATTQNSLAIAYSNRIRGDRADNLEPEFSR